MNPRIAEAVVEVVNEALRLGLDAVLIGGVASELLAGKDPLLPQPRGTNDADFAVRTPDWATFDRLTQALVARGFDRTPVEHRLARNSVLVDLVPHGEGVAGSDGRLIWPGSGFEMRVTGFDEACAAAEPCAVAGQPVRCVTAPALALLKLFSFRDRRGRGDMRYRNDAEDLFYWMSHHALGKEEHRRFGLAGIGMPDVEYSHAGAALLGWDVGILTSPSASVELLAVISGLDDEYGPFVSAIVRPVYDEDRPRVAAVANASCRGCLAASNLK